MASSSVSQDDIDTDFEKNSRRSRIRTARAARQINAAPSAAASCRAELLLCDYPPDVEHDCGEHPESSLMGSSSGLLGGSLGASGASAAGGGNPSPANNNGAGNAAPTEEEGARRVRGGVKKGKQHRERRKLREKRRSTGVVHLASTESTGGSTTPDEMESSDNETKRNTMLNESDNVLLSNANTSSASNIRQQHIPSDLEADDENDAEHSSYRSPHASNHHQQQIAGSSPLLGGGAEEPPVVEKVVEENRRLLSMMDEKDKRIHHLEYKIEQLLKDTLTISEEQSRLQKENKTLLRALNNLSSKDKP